MDIVNLLTYILMALATRGEAKQRKRGLASWALPCCCHVRARLYHGPASTARQRAHLPACLEGKHCPATNILNEHDSGSHRPRMAYLIQGHAMKMIRRKVIQYCHLQRSGHLSGSLVELWGNETVRTP
ncbi:hypothetical protein F5I97DRAFT_942430 [Phlebopus sp. FC_14]|nr:hypothetical protein F5I97DRAFT_942430 [Phlebopus sp. FC_14]